jgi:flagellar hook-associated protein 2
MAINAAALDVNGIVSQLMAAEQRPLNLLKSQEQSFRSRLSSYGSLKSAVSSLESAMKSLAGSTTGFSANTVSVSNTAIASASVTGKAAAGSYAITVTQLAQQQKLTSVGVADPAASLGSGSLRIAVGPELEVTVTPTENSLLGLRDAINASKAGVTATVVNDGSANGHRLVLTANQSGAANTIRITASDGSDPGLTQFNYDPASPVVYDAANPSTGMSQLQAARDAKLTVDGLAVTKPSNQISDAIQGISLKLTELTKDTPVTLTVGRDAATVKASVASFVKAYNALNQTVSGLTAYNANTKSAGALQGDSAANAILTRMRGELSKAAEGAGTLRTLSDIGVSIQKDGSLKVDDAKLQTAIDKNFDSIGALFTATDGYATRLAALAGEMLADKGVISARTAGLDESIKNITKREEAVQTRLDSLEARYRKQFSALDVALSSMQNTSNYLTQQLAALSANTK